MQFAVAVESRKQHLAWIFARILSENHTTLFEVR